MDLINWKHATRTCLQLIDGSNRTTNPSAYESFNCCVMKCVKKRWLKKWKYCIFKAGQGWSVWCEYPWQIATIYPNAAPPSITAVLRLSKHNLISFQNLNLFSKQHLNSCFFKTRVILQYMFKHSLREYGRVQRLESWRGPCFQNEKKQTSEMEVATP